MKKYPTHEATSMLMAEDVREEVGGKLSILGFFSGGNIVVGKPSDAPKGIPLGMPMLCFLWIFRDGDGHFDAKTTVLDPSGKEVFSCGPMAVDRTKEGWANLAIKATPFIMPMAGLYKCKIDFGDGHTHEREFNVAFS